MKKKKTTIAVIVVLFAVVIFTTVYLCVNIIIEQNMISNTESAVSLMLNAINGFSTDEFSDIDSQNEKYIAYFKKHAVSCATSDGIDSLLSKWWTIAPNGNSEYGLEVDCITVTPTSRNEAEFYANVVIVNMVKNPIRTVVVKGRIRTDSSFQNRIDYFGFDGFSQAELSKIRMESANY